MMISSSLMMRLKKKSQVKTNIKTPYNHLMST